MRIAVTGASGLVGSALVPALRDAGHDVVVLVRREPTSPGEIRWDPAAGTIDAESLRGIDGAVHLAGENIGQRWSERARERILRSRVDGTVVLARTLASLEPRPAVLVQASGVGYYGFASAQVDEASPKGSGFAADVVDRFEHAAEPARDAGIRVVSLRKGPVMARHGGALARMLLPFSLGVGGRVGSGRQWWSWLSLPDAVRTYRFALESDLSGPVNVVGGATPNAEFARTLARVLHRPAVVPAPAFAVKLLFGQMGEEMLLGGQRAEPRRLTEAGFAFEHTELEACLAAAVAK